jgi:uncharacterized pyridoxamine 5'-phosphate oxidase family protein
MKTLIAIILGLSIYNIVDCQEFSVHDLIEMWVTEDLDRMHDICVKQGLHFDHVKYVESKHEQQYIFTNKPRWYYPTEPHEETTNVIRTDKYKMINARVNISVTTDKKELYIMLKEEVESMEYKLVKTINDEDEPIIETIYEGSQYIWEFSYIGNIESQRYMIKMTCKE